MQALSEYAREHSSTLNRYRAVPSVHGLLVDFNEAWLALWQLSRSLPAAVVDDLLDQVEELFPFLPFESFPPLPLVPFLSRRGVLPSAPSWLQATLGGGSPTSWSEVNDFTASLRGLWPQGVDPFVIYVATVDPSDDRIRRVDGNGLNVVVIQRPRARAVSRTTANDPIIGGLSIGKPGGRATLGGILEGPGGERYGVTCAHAMEVDDTIEQAAPADGDPASRPIGDCVYRSVLTPSTDCQVGAAPNHADVALVEIVDGVASDFLVMDVGAPTSCATPLSTRIPVDVSARTGKHGLHLGPLAATYDIVIDGETHCFDDLMVLLPTVCGANPIEPGCSGAWVTHEVVEEGEVIVQWDGMVIGADADMAFALSSEAVLADVHAGYDDEISLPSD